MLLLLLLDVFHFLAPFPDEMLYRYFFDSNRLYGFWRLTLLSRDSFFTSFFTFLASCLSKLANLTAYGTRQHLVRQHQFIADQIESELRQSLAA